MKRINVIFDDTMFKKLESHMKEKKCSSIPQSIRELIEIGLQAEAITHPLSVNRKKSDELSFMITLMKNHLKWTLETLLITRCLVEQGHSNASQNAEHLLLPLKEQAMKHVKKIFSELGETSI